MKKTAQTLDEVIGGPRLKATYVAFCTVADSVVDAAEKYANQQGRKIDFHVCPRLTYETVISTYHDIVRHKVFHLPDPIKNKSDAVKRAAYFAKWILKFRPILVIDHEAVNDPAAANELPGFLNEHLALEWGLVCIAKEQGFEDLFFTKKVRIDLLYYFHFRELTTDGYLSIFQLIADLANARQLNPIIEFPPNCILASRPSKPD